MPNIRTGEDRRRSIIDAKGIGYEIILNREGDSVRVAFSGKFTKNPYTLTKRYSADIPDDAIRQDCIYELFQWAGLYYESRLTVRV